MKRIKQKVIATCTTIPSRCEHVVEMAKSLFENVAYAPDLLVLNLFKGDWPDGLPDFISEYQKIEKRFEVYWTEENYWSATKLIPSIKRFPEAVLIAVDDDKLYQPTLVSTLLSKHLEHPNCVVSMKCEKIRRVFGKIEISVYGQSSLEEDLYMIPCTGAGCLFPPHVFDKTHVADAKMFEEWQKPQDDRWWWMNYTMNGVKSVSAVEFFSDIQFRSKDFTTADAIHNYLWVPENIRELDRKCCEWLSKNSQLVFMNIPSMKISGIQNIGNDVVLIDEYGISRKLVK